MNRRKERIAMVDFNKCKPEECSGDGTCIVLDVCPKDGVIVQLDKNDPPVINPDMCQGCYGLY